MAEETRTNSPGVGRRHEAKLAPDAGAFVSFVGMLPCSDCGSGFGTYRPNSATGKSEWVRCADCGSTNGEVIR